MVLSLADRAAMAAKNGGKFCAFAFFLYLCSHSHGEKQMMKIVILDGYGANPGDLLRDIRRTRYEDRNAECIRK